MDGWMMLHGWAFFSCSKKKISLMLFILCRNNTESIKSLHEGLRALKLYWQLQKIRRWKKKRRNLWKTAAIQGSKNLKKGLQIGNPNKVKQAIVESKRHACLVNIWGLKYVRNYKNFFDCLTRVIKFEKKPLFESFSSVNLILQNFLPSHAIKNRGDPSLKL